MPGSREVVLIDAPDLVDDYLTVRFAPLGRVARLSSRAFDDAARLGALVERAPVSDVVVWLSETADDELVQRAVEAMLPGVATAGGSLVVLVGEGVADERTDWLRALAAAHPSTQLHLLRHAPVAGAFWDCRGDLQTLTSAGHVALPELADAVAAVMSDRTPGYGESSLTMSE